MDKTIYYPYNETFKCYNRPLVGKSAEKFLEDRNQCKGGHWVLHTKEQFQEWYKKKGQHLEFLGIDIFE